MFSTSEEIEREVYLPQSYLYLWEGHYQIPYLLSDEALARTDALNFIQMGQAVMIELWCFNGREDIKLDSWRRM